MSEPMLEPCPWPGCGSNDVSLQGRGHAQNAEYFVRCHSCGMCGPLSCLPGSEEEAARLWNDRPASLMPDTDIREALEWYVAAEDRAMANDETIDLREFSRIARAALKSTEPEPEV